MSTDENGGVEKPWGKYYDFVRTRDLVVKQIHVKQGQALSLQRHKERDEVWVVTEGQGEATVGRLRLPLHPGEVIHVPAGVTHCIRAADNFHLTLVEVQVGTNGRCSENDIIRLHDPHKRPVNEV